MHNMLDGCYGNLTKLTFGPLWRVCLLKQTSWFSLLAACCRATKMSAEVQKVDPKSTRLPKRVVNGLEFPHKLTYLNWEPGGEYTQSLIMKNVKLTTQRIKFKLTSNQFSSPNCHQPLILCAGTSYALPVTFRPSGKSPCEELIEFETADGKVISVPIKAVLSRPKLTITEQLKFGMCAVKGCINMNFEITNVGNVSTFYSWQSPTGFSIVPKEGHLAPKETCRHCATFCPQSAKVYDDLATCVYSDRAILSNIEEEKPKESVFTKVMKVEGIGKYPYVTVKAAAEPKDQETNIDSIQDMAVDFGSVAVGKFSERSIQVSNPSPVTCTFSIQPFLMSADTSTSPFVCVDSTRSLRPHTSISVKLKYAPKLLSDNGDISYFQVQAEGSLGLVKVKCTGLSVGPGICVENEHSVVNFGNVQCGKSSTALIRLRNKSKVPTIYQLKIDESSVFCCDAVSGTLAGLSSQCISVKFVPKYPIPYCRSVSLIIKDQDPLYLYFIGTGFSEVVIPALLQPKDILKYHEHSQSGISLMPPERLKELLDKGMLMPETDCDILKSSSRSILSLPPVQQSSDTSSYGKYFQSENEISLVQHISCDIDKINFGYCSPSFSSDGKILTITNHTYGEVSCVWMSANCKCFEVAPQERVILPRKSATFTVCFKPDKPSHFYNTEIECYIYYKDLSDYTHVNALTVTPPWSVTLLLSGHTFNRDFGMLTTESSFDSEDVIFSPAVVGHSAYQTVVLRNPGTEPTIFKFEEDSDNIFKAKPSIGILKDEFQLIVIQMTPKEAKVYNRVLTYRLTSTASVRSKRLFVRGCGELPKLSLTNKGQLYFKPTCVETTSCLSYTVRNTSGFPLRFEWKHPSHTTKAKVFSVQPASGSILPNEIQEHKWYFTPKDPTEYKLKSVLHSYLATPHMKSKSILEVIGTGASGVINCDPAVYDFGVMVVGTSKYCHLSLSNTGPCNMNYSLSAVQNGIPVSRDVVELSQTEGVIYARSTVHVKVTVRPCQRETRHCTINYSVLSQSKDTEFDGLAPGNLPLCQITFVGVFPSLDIVDILGEGVASQISKAILWKMLSIHKINQSLKKVPPTSELRYAIGSRHSLRRKLPVKSRIIIDCDFGAAPQNSENCIIHLVLKNDGAVTTEWAFLMSHDVWLEPEFWSDFGELDEVEKNEEFVLINDLFTISPMKGRLEPGACVSIVCTHKHSRVGVGKLPVLLKINSGREIVLNMSGVTVEKGCPYLHIGCKQYKFDPVPIGLQSYPVQAFPLYNGGDTMIGYEVGTGILDEMTEQNYHMPIFECIKPTGSIAPGRTLPLEFIFSPVEAKKYSVNVPVYLSSGDTTTITLVGEGYDQNQAYRRCSDSQTPNYPFSEHPMCPHDVASFSHECVNIGCVPQFATVERIVFIKNTSQHTLSYSWDKDVKKVITVEPNEGYIQPGESTPCTVIFSSNSPPNNYSFDLICRITDESQLANHLAALRKWNEKNEDEKYALLITQDSDSTQPSLSKSPCHPQSTSTEFRSRLRALPPIGEPQQSYEEWKRSDLSTKSKRRPPSKKVTVEKGPPVPPTQILLRLHVTAKTMSISDYVKYCGDLDDFYTDQYKYAMHNSVMCCVQQQEVNFQKFVLNQILKEILEDSDFKQALHRIVEEPIPYFSQFSTRVSGNSVESSETVDIDDVIPRQGGADSAISVPEKTDPRSKLLSAISKELSGNVDPVDSEECPSSSLSVINNDEVHSIVEAAFQNTLFNTIIEANQGEFTVDRPFCTITKSNT